MQLLFHLLRALAQKIDVLALALGADVRHFFGVIAVVAQHAPVAAMVGQRDRAVHATDALSASPASDRARKSAPVKQQHGLLAVLQPERNSLKQPPRKGGLFSRL